MILVCLGNYFSRLPFLDLAQRASIRHTFRTVELQQFLQHESRRTKRRYGPMFLSSSSPYIDPLGFLLSRSWNMRGHQPCSLVVRQTAMTIASKWVTILIIHRFCQHRWPAIAGMVGFRNNVGNAALVGWVSPSSQQIAFARGTTLPTPSSFNRGIILCSRIYILQARSASWPSTIWTPRGPEHSRRAYLQDRTAT
jgi:hypothetical protein